MLALAVGITDFGIREKLLAQAETEARAIENLIQANNSQPAAVALLLGAKATKANVRDAWKGLRHMHFATH